MAILYVARSAKLARWASEVGFGRHVYKIGVSQEPPKALAAAGWAGETDWTIVRQQNVEDLSEAEVLARIGRREKAIDPTLYPRLRGAAGIFRLSAERVENHVVVRRALAGERAEVKLKPVDFADYLIAGALR
jgi:hypothetical protein